MWADIAENFEGRFRIEIRELVSAGDALATDVEGYGVARSGVEIRQRWAQLLTFRDGLVLRVQQPFPDIASALEAARSSGQRRLP
jgi:ketosteroid isomerase-like protein